MHAGQGLVAFARGVHDQLDYAIKFILNQSSLAAELALYGSRTLGPLLPQVRCPALMCFWHKSSLAHDSLCCVVV